MKKLKDAKSAERRAREVLLKITLRQIISKELFFPAISATKLSGLEMLLGFTTDFINSFVFKRCSSSLMDIFSAVEAS